MTAMPAKQHAKTQPVEANAITQSLASIPTPACHYQAKTTGGVNEMEGDYPISEKNVRAMRRAINEGRGIRFEEPEGSVTVYYHDGAIYPKEDAARLPLWKLEEHWVALVLGHVVVLGCEVVAEIGMEPGKELDNEQQAALMAKLEPLVSDYLCCTSESRH